MYVCVFRGNNGEHLYYLRYTVGVDTLKDADLYEYVNKVIVHPGYNSKTLDNDIALIKIERAKGVGVVPIIPKAENNYYGEWAVASGWGKCKYT